MACHLVDGLIEAVTQTWYAPPYFLSNFWVRKFQTNRVVHSLCRYMGEESVGGKEIFWGNLNGFPETVSTIEIQAWKYLHVQNLYSSGVLRYFLCK